MYTTAQIYRGSTVHIIEVEGRDARVLCKDDSYYAPGAVALPITKDIVTCKKCWKNYEGCEQPKGVTT